MRGHVAKKGKRYYVVLDVGVDEHGKRKHAGRPEPAPGHGRCECEQCIAPCALA